MTPFIQLNGHRFPLNEINELVPSSSFERSALDFIRRWQSQEQTFLLHTSGSTGTPKPIQITRKQMQASARFTIDALGLKPGQTALVCLDPDYIAGKMMLVRALVNSMNIILELPSSNPLLNLEGSPDFAAFVPMQLQEILAHPGSKAKLNLMHAVIVGGAAVGPALQSRLQDIDAPVYATYGMTESVSHIALKKLNGNGRSDVFKAFDEVKLKVDERGCLIIQSVLTNDEIITTNDLVELYDNNQFEWLGRIDHVINTGGVKVQGEKVEKVIENAFHRLGILKRYFVAGMPDERLGEMVVLAIEGAEPLAQEREVMKMLKKDLTRYEMPKKILYIAGFQETATGKVNKQQTLLSNRS